MSREYMKTGRGDRYAADTLSFVCRDSFALLWRGWRFEEGLVWIRPMNRCDKVCPFTGNYTLYLDDPRVEACSEIPRWDWRLWFDRARSVLS